LDSRMSCQIGFRLPPRLSSFQATIQAAPSKQKAANRIL
jgi:hypothetical protein